MSITSVRLNDDVERPLESLSKKLDRSKSYLINQAVRKQSGTDPQLKD